MAVGRQTQMFTLTEPGQPGDLSRFVPAAVAQMGPVGIEEPNEQSRNCTQPSCQPQELVNFFSAQTGFILVSVTCN